MFVCELENFVSARSCHEDDVWENGCLTFLQMDSESKEVDRAHSDPGPRGDTPPPSLRELRGLPPLHVPTSVPVRLRRLASHRPKWRRIMDAKGHRLVRLELEPPSIDAPEDEGFHVTKLEFSNSDETKHVPPTPQPTPPARDTTEVQNATQAALRTLLRTICPGPQHRKLRRVILALSTLIIAGGVVTLTGLAATKQA